MYAYVYACIHKFYVERLCLFQHLPCLYTHTHLLMSIGSALVQVVQRLEQFEVWLEQLWFTCGSAVVQPWLLVQLVVSGIPMVQLFSCVVGRPAVREYREP